jgi:hypothetical protein
MAKKHQSTMNVQQKMTQYRSQHSKQDLDSGHTTSEFDHETYNYDDEDEESSDQTTAKRNSDRMLPSEYQSMMHTTNRHDAFDILSEKPIMFDKPRDDAPLLQFLDTSLKIQIFDADGTQRTCQSSNEFRVKLNQQLGRGA